MTFREKLKEEHPEYVSSIYTGGAYSCPFKHYYERKDDRPCKNDLCAISCRECWDREMPEDKL